jgi:hypothetical protein
VPNSVWPGIILSHWGRTDAHPASNTAYPPDNYTQPYTDEWQPTDWRHNYLHPTQHPCFDPKKVQQTAHYDSLSLAASAQRRSTAANYTDVPASCQMAVQLSCLGRLHCDARHLQRTQHNVSAWVQDLLLPFVHLPRAYKQSPLQGAPPRVRTILMFFRGDVGKYR